MHEIRQAGVDRARRIGRRAALLAASVIGALCLAHCRPADAQTADAAWPDNGVSLTSPIEVIDAATFQAGGVRYRLDNIEPPSLYGAQCPAERLLASHGALILSALIIDSDHVSVTTSGRDREGRTLARLWVNGEDAGEILIAAGVAAPFTGARVAWCARQVAS